MNMVNRANSGHGRRVVGCSFGLDCDLFQVEFPIILSSVPSSRNRKLTFQFG